MRHIFPKVRATKDSQIRVSNGECWEEMVKIKSIELCGLGKFCSSLYILPLILMVF